MLGAARHTGKGAGDPGGLAPAGEGVPRHRAEGPQQGQFLLMAVLPEIWRLCSDNFNPLWG